MNADEIPAIFDNLFTLITHFSIRSRAGCSVAQTDINEGLKKRNLDYLFCSLALRRGTKSEESKMEGD